MVDCTIVGSPNRQRRPSCGVQRGLGVGECSTSLRYAVGVRCFVAAVGGRKNIMRGDVIFFTCGEMLIFPSGAILIVYQAGTSTTKESN